MLGECLFTPLSHIFFDPAVPTIRIPDHRGNLS